MRQAEQQAAAVFSIGWSCRVSRASARGGWEGRDEEYEKTNEGENGELEHEGYKQA